jgi:hypothetical protein
MAATQLLARIRRSRIAGQGRSGDADCSGRRRTIGRDCGAVRSAAAETPAPASPAIEPTAAESDGTPELLLRARPGDTLESLYLRIYRSVTPPSFASVAALQADQFNRPTLADAVQSIAQLLLRRCTRSNSATTIGWDANVGTAIRSQAVVQLIA